MFKLTFPEGILVYFLCSLRTAKIVRTISLALRRQSRFLQLKHFPSYDGHICQWKSKYLTHHICSLFVFRSHLLTLPTKTSWAFSLAVGTAEGVQMGPALKQLPFFSFPHRQRHLQISQHEYGVASKRVVEATF